MAAGADECYRHIVARTHHCCEHGLGAGWRLVCARAIGGAGPPMPGAGKVVRVPGRGMAEDVITGLSVPTGMTFGPDGALYI